jgi:pimeloyl-ACP methyl ester carboxylesterase
MSLIDGLPRARLGRPPVSVVVILRLIGLVLLLAWFGLFLYLRANESRIVFMATRTHWSSIPIDATAFHRVQFSTSDGLSLEGLQVGTTDPWPYWILFCSASGMTIHMTEVQEQLRTLRSFGYGVFSFDYRGFGGNAGEPTEEGVYIDAESAYRYLTQNLHVPPTRVILAGRSLGSAVAVELATRVHVAGLVLFSPIDSVPLVGARLYPWFPVRHFARNQFDSLGKVGRLQSPVVLVYGTTDEMLPVDVARSLYDKIRAPKLMLETAAGHYDAGFNRGAQLLEALSRFWPPTQDAFRGSETFRR